MEYKTRTLRMPADLYDRLERIARSTEMNTSPKGGARHSVNSLIIEACRAFIVPDSKQKPAKRRTTALPHVA